MINGKRIPSNFPNVAEMYKSLKENERIIFDIESGYPYKVTKEYYDWHMKMWESALPRAFRDNSKPIGIVWITGTGGDGFSKCSTDAKEMFYNPEKYNIKPYGDYDTDSETY
jgi:hypothetical protein